MRLKVLMLEYRGVNGLKVFILGIFTVLPFFLGLKFEALRLSLSFSHIVYIVYHSFGVFVWWM